MLFRNGQFIWIFVDINYCFDSCTCSLLVIPWRLLKVQMSMMVPLEFKKPLAMKTYLYIRSRKTIPIHILFSFWWHIPYIGLISKINTHRSILYDNDIVLNYHIITEEMVLQNEKSACVRRNITYICIDIS